MGNICLPSPRGPDNATLRNPSLPHRHVVRLVRQNQSEVLSVGDQLIVGHIPVHALGATGLRHKSELTVVGDCKWTLTSRRFGFRECSPQLCTPLIVHHRKTISPCTTPN